MTEQEEIEARMRIPLRELIDWYIKTGQSLDVPLFDWPPNDTR